MNNGHAFFSIFGKLKKKIITFTVVLDFTDKYDSLSMMFQKPQKGKI